MPCSWTSRPPDLDLRLDADARGLLQREQDQERRAEREGADGREAERLDAELVQATAVEEAGGAGREALGLRREGEEAEGERAPDAGHAVRGDRADRVVDPDPLDSEHAEDDDHAGAEADHDCAPHGATNAQAAVIATSAAIAPFSIIEMSGFLITSQDVMSAPNTPAAAAMFVFRAT